MSLPTPNASLGAFHPGNLEKVNDILDGLFDKAEREKGEAMLGDQGSAESHAREQVEDAGSNGVCDEMRKGNTGASPEIEMDQAAKERAAKTAKNKKKKENARRNKAAAAEEAKKPLYEVMDSLENGKGLFARVAIKAGVEIFREAPLTPVLSRDWLCIEASIMAISEEKREKFFALRSECKCEQNPCIETPVMKIWDSNSFMIEPHRNEAKEVFNQVYEIASRSNHSCLPNAARGYTKELGVSFRAVRDIAAGEEITNDWGEAGVLAPRDRNERRQLISKAFGFTCNCRACQYNLDVSHFMGSAKPVFSLDDMRIIEEQTADVAVTNQTTPEEHIQMREVKEWADYRRARFENLIPDVAAILAGLVARGFPEDPHAGMVMKAGVICLRQASLEDNPYNLEEEVFNKCLERHFGNPSVMELLKDTSRLLLPEARRKFRALGI